jgi:hypothetical protein
MPEITSVDAPGPNYGGVTSLGKVFKPGSEVTRGAMALFESPEMRGIVAYHRTDNNISQFAKGVKTVKAIHHPFGIVTFFGSSSLP